MAGREPRSHQIQHLRKPLPRGGAPRVTSCKEICPRVIGLLREHDLQFGFVRGEAPRAIVNLDLACEGAIDHGLAADRNSKAGRLELHLDVLLRRRGIQWASDLNLITLLRPVELTLATLLLWIVVVGVFLRSTHAAHTAHT